VFRDAATDLERNEQLMNNIWETLYSPEYTYTTKSYKGYNKLTLNCSNAMPTFPLTNDLTPDNSSYYVLAKGYI